MIRRKVKKETFRRLLCLLLCITMVGTEIPTNDHRVSAATTQRKTKFVKAEPEVFVPSAGEKTTITFNLESKRTVNIYVKDGKKVIANLVKNQEYRGGYVEHTIQWNGKTDNGTSVGSGTYKIVVEPVGKYKKYRSITNVWVVGDTEKEIYIAPNTSSDTFNVYGKGGSNQSISKVIIDVAKNSQSEKIVTAKIDKNLWHAEVKMSNYDLYDLTAKITSILELRQAKYQR